MTERKEISLGMGLPQSGVAAAVEPKTLEDRVKALEEGFRAITRAFHASRDKAEVKEEKNDFGEQPINSDGIPLNTTLMGITKGTPYILVVDQLGRYIVGKKEFNSLSAAAEAVSGVRRSGWVFWCTNDGRTAKEAFRRK